MVTQKKLKVAFVFFAYGGNGAVASETPDLRKWMMKIITGIKADERIEDPVVEMTISDTPITMSRNQAVVEARKLDVDVLVMVDSDMNPFRHAGEPEWKEFFSSSFDFLYDHYEKGPCVIAAPYCGPPGDAGSENVYIFTWNSFGDLETKPSFTLQQYSRVEASKMRGIQEAAALPTGLIMYDMRAFKLIEPHRLSNRQIVDKIYNHEVTRDKAMTLLQRGWFFYEWKDGTAAEKVSTEDVTNTRDISMAGMIKLGYNPVFCNWDSPAGHWKPWCVAGRPRVYDVDNVAKCFFEAAQNPYKADERIVEAKNPFEGREGK